MMKSRSEIAELIYHARLDKQMTQQRLSDLSGISRLTICNIERGRVDCRYSTLVALAKVLGLTIKVETINVNLSGDHRINPQ